MAMVGGGLGRFYQKHLLRGIIIIPRNMEISGPMRYKSQGPIGDQNESSAKELVPGGPGVFFQLQYILNPFFHLPRLVYIDTAFFFEKEAGASPFSN